MYSLIVRRNIRNAFAQINKGNYAAIVKQFGPNAEHVFYGEHALAGSRFTHAGIARWYKRLPAAFPNLRFDLKKIVVNGWPWDTTVAVEWVDHFSMGDGARGSNQGVHVFGIRWGKVVSLHIYCDTEKLMGYLERLAEQGVEEARAPAIDEARPA
ncbi:MAG: nuclear transport factor 2 family protein [Chloroflexia bacterium]